MVCNLKRTNRKTIATLPSRVENRFLSADMKTITARGVLILWSFKSCVSNHLRKVHTSEMIRNRRNSMKIKENLIF